MQKIMSKAEVLVSKLRPRHLLIAFFLLLLAFVMLWSASRIKKVTVDIDGEKQTVVTALASPYRVLEELEIELEPEDRLTVTGFGDGGFFGELGENEAEIKIQSAVDVEISADELKYHITLAEGDTVSDALEARELIKLSVLENCEYTPRETADELARAVGADVVGVIGRKIILYRESKEHKKIELK